jgi:predicted DNA-binding transcriptional regulator AlpA
MHQLLTYETLVSLGYINNRVTLSRRIRRGEFPPPIRVGSRNVAWLKDEIDAWQALRIADRDKDLQRQVTPPVSPAGAQPSNR